MRIVRVALVLAFFLPVACEVGNALATPMHPCGKTTHSEPIPDRNLPCCLSALLDRSAVRSPQIFPNIDLAVSPAVLAHVPPLDLVGPSAVIARTARVREHSPPPRELYTIHLSLLI